VDNFRQQLPNRWETYLKGAGWSTSFVFTPEGAERLLVAAMISMPTQRVGSFGRLLLSARVPPLERIRDIRRGGAPGRVRTPPRSVPRVPGGGGSLASPVFGSAAAAGLPQFCQADRRSASPQSLLE
jgi:hypothetical protein